jgi:general stress protein 26
MTDTQREKTQALDKLRELLSKFEDAMLVTTDVRGQPHARPMRIAACDHAHLDDIWFASALDSGKIEEIRKEPRVAVTMADGSRFLSLSGHARVVVDQGKIADLWQDSWKIWFPEGPASGNIALIQVRPLRAEYWDQSLPQGFRLAIEAAKAWIRDEAI